MRKVNIGSPFGGKFDLEWVGRALKDIERASHEEVPGEVFDEYVVENNPTPTRTLDVATATAADIAAVLGTIIQDMQRRGVKRGA